MVEGVLLVYGFGLCHGLALGKSTVKADVGLVESVELSPVPP